MLLGAAAGVLVDAGAGSGAGGDVLLEEIKRKQDDEGSTKEIAMHLPYR